MQQEELHIQSMKQIQQEHKLIEDICRQEISNTQADVYNEVSTSSADVGNEDALLLPSVDPESTEILELKNLSGIDRVAVTSYCQVQRQKTKCALEQAQFYRSLAERLKTEK